VCVFARVTSGNNYPRLLGFSLIEDSRALKSQRRTRSKQKEKRKRKKDIPSISNRQLGLFGLLHHSGC
jgi:hypothetical protein